MITDASYSSTDWWSSIGGGSKRVVEEDWIEFISAKKIITNNLVIIEDVANDEQNQYSYYSTFLMLNIQYHSKTK